MRTTLTLEPAIAERIRRIANARGQGMQELVNGILREGLKVIEERPARRPGRFIVEPHDFAVRPGIDLDTIGRLADEIAPSHDHS
jgi:hypothetical protein